MLFAGMFSCISRRKTSAKSQRPKKTSRKSSSLDATLRKRKITISSFINLLKRKNKTKAGSQATPTSNNDATPHSGLADSNRSESGNNHSLSCTISLSSTGSGSSTTHPSHSGCGDQQEFQHTIIYVSPADVKQTTDTTIARPSKVEVSPKKSKRSAKITRASALTRECTSLPSLEPYRHRLHLHLRRAAGSVSGQRCSSAQPSEFSQSTKATNVKPVFELPLSPSKREDSMSIVSFTHLSPSSPTSSLSLENYTITTRPPSRHGIAYEIVFDVPSVQRCYTPELRLSSDHTYSFPRATTKFMAAEELNDDWNSDGEFEDSDESENEEKAVDEKKESGSEQKANLSLPVPECKYGVFFTAAKPPLPPSALERIRRYRNYEL